MADSVTIAQQGGPAPLRVTLAETEAPHGRRRIETAWETGGELKLGTDGGLYLPGNPRPIYQVLQTRERPLVLHGHSYDHLTGIPGRARDLQAIINRIWRQARAVTIAWGSEVWEGLLQEPKWMEESSDGLKYELRFLVSRAPDDDDAPIATTDQVRSASSPQDVAAQMRAHAAERRAELATLATTRQTSVRLGELWRQVEAALAVVDSAITVAAQSALADVRATVQLARRVIASATNAQSAVRVLRDEVNSLSGLAALVRPRAPEVHRWSAHTAGTAVDLTQILAQLRELVIARRLIVQGSQVRFYRVVEGDTLESVALIVLGSRARAGDLQLTQAQLVPGATVQVPAA